jgi:hypothetical protein
METSGRQRSSVSIALAVILLTSCNGTMEPIAEVPQTGIALDSTAGNARCVSALGWSTPLPSVYSWIEWFADGHRDTIFASGRQRYPGSGPQRFLGSRSASSEVEPIERLPLDSFRVCPEDSLYSKAVSGDTLVFHRTTADTIRLNYGTQAADSLVAPKVSFANPAKTAALLDTLVSGPWGRDAGIEIAHFNGDSVRFSLTAPAKVSLALHHATIDTQYDCEGMPTGTVRRLDHSPQDLPLLLRWTYLGAANTGKTLDISIVARNRFGFADTLRLRSLVVAPHCPAP